MPSRANLSMRGVGIVPPYTPKVPQPMLSKRMKTMLGFFFCADCVSVILVPPYARPREEPSSWFSPCDRYLPICPSKSRSTLLVQETFDWQQKFVDDTCSTSPP